MLLNKVDDACRVKQEEDWPAVHQIAAELVAIESTPNVHPTITEV